MTSPTPAVHADRRALMATAVAAAARAAPLIRERAATLPADLWEEKSPADFVTEADRDAERLIREIILERHPDAKITGEELSPGQIADSGLAFIVDPIDGTTNFLHAYPAYAVSIAALRDGALVAGVVLNAATGELFTATLGGGARRGGGAIQVSTIERPSHALIGTGFPFKHPDYIPDYLQQFERILRTTSGIRRAGSAALDLADVACGRFDGFWELMLAPWDVAAGLLLIREAGGLGTDLAGAPAGLAHSAIVAGNPAIHPWLLRILRETA